MAETAGECPEDPHGTTPESRLGSCLDWVFRLLLVVSAVPSLLLTIACVVVFAHDAPGLARALLGGLPVPLACAGLVLPWTVLFAGRTRMALALVAGCIVAHQTYASFAMWRRPMWPWALFAFCGIVLATGTVSLALYTRRTQRRVLPIALGLVLVLACFVFGSGDPQWSRYIFMWQVHYSPSRREADNLPTNRRSVRETLPKYREWDAQGRVIREWTHPNSTLLRTEYYPNGQKRMERLYAEDQFVTSWYPNGRMEYQYDQQTRRRCAWKTDGTPRDGEVITTFPGTDKVQSVCQYKDGYLDGVHRYWNPYNDNLMRETHYRNGLTHGRERCWSIEGVLTSEEYYVHGYRDGPRRYFRNDGSLDWEEFYVHGVLHGQRRNYPARH